MYSHYSSNSQPSAQIIRTLWKQQQELSKHPPDCVTPIINNNDLWDIQADISGPKGTPYEEGWFRVKLNIPPDFPRTPPKGIFITKIYHPNISDKGEICVNTLKKDWNPKKWSLYNWFEVIKCLLIVPFPESSWNEEAGKIFMDNYDEYYKVARIYTQVHAGTTKRITDVINDNNHTPNKDHNLIVPGAGISDTGNMISNYEDKNYFMLTTPLNTAGSNEKLKLNNLPFIQGNSIGMSPMSNNRTPKRSKTYNIIEDPEDCSRIEINKWLTRI